MEIKDLLYDELKGGLEEIKELNCGSKEYGECVKNISALADRLIQIEKFEIEREDKLLSSEKELEVKKSEASNNKKIKFVDSAIALAGILVPSLITIWGTKVSLDFEKEGTVTTVIGRGFLQKLLPRK